LPRSAKDAWTLEEIVNKLGIARTTAQSQLKTLVATKVVSVVRHEGKKSSKKNPKRFWLDATPPAPTITVSVGPKKLKF
jgi:predicted ArsR family transcriptional regulator